MLLIFVFLGVAEQLDPLGTKRYFNFFSKIIVRNKAFIIVPSDRTEATLN